MGFQDCKVFIHSVDAQSSANGGITILVIGEMSNHNGPWRKFVQSFFLAEQPNGYFVLNDMFRFLKEETVEGDDASESEGAAAAPEVAPAAAAVPEPVPAPTQPPFESQHAHPPARTTSPPYDHVPAASEEALTPVVALQEPPSPVAEPETQPVLPPINGIHNEEPEQAPRTPIEDSTPSLPASQPVVATSSPSTASVTLLASAATPTAGLPQLQPQMASLSAAAPASTPTAPKTWANLAAANSKKWGAAVAQESRGTTEVPATASTPPGSGTQTPATPHAHRGSGHGHLHQNSHSHQHGRGEHAAILAAQGVTTAQCFVKVRKYHDLAFSFPHSFFSNKSSDRALRSLSRRKHSPPSSPPVSGRSKRSRSCVPRPALSLSSHSSTPPRRPSSLRYRRHRAEKVESGLTLVVTLGRLGFRSKPGRSVATGQLVDRVVVGLLMGNHAGVGIGHEAGGGGGVDLLATSKVGCSGDSLEVKVEANGEYTSLLFFTWVRIKSFLLFLVLA